MARTATLIGLTHDGKWEMIASPGVSILEQQKTFKDFLGRRGHEKWSQVLFQESDGHARIVRFLTESKAKEAAHNRAKEQDAAKKQAKLDDVSAKIRQRELSNERAKRHSEEIDALNKVTLANPNRGGKVADEQEAATEAMRKVSPNAVIPVDEKTGLRLDGPTPSEWAAAGMLPEDYPPQGFAKREDKGA